MRMVLQAILISVLAEIAEIYACMVVVGYVVGIDVSWRLLLWFWIIDIFRRVVGFE